MRASSFLTVSFSVIVAVVAVALCLGAWRASRGESPKSARVFTLGLAVWLLVTAGVAHAGLLSDFSSRPPKLFLVPFAGVALALVVGLGSLGRRAIERLPLWWIVLLQGFRFPLELVMHRAYEEGVMPVQMSFSGRNFDIVTGITAFVVAFLLYRGALPRWALQLWNVMGFGLLLNVVIIAILSLPTPFRAFPNDPPNVWVTRAPFVWLPAVLVMTALLGHVLIFRAGLQSARSAKFPQERLT